MLFSEALYLLLIWSLVNPALGLPLFRGLSPLRKVAWGPQVGLDSMSEAAEASDTMNIAKLFTYLLGSC